MDIKSRIEDYDRKQYELKTEQLKILKDLGWQARKFPGLKQYYYVKEINGERYMLGAASAISFSYEMLANGKVI